MTMKEVASVLELSTHSFVAKLETGEKTPSVEMALKISRFFNISLDRLLKDELEIED